MAHYDLYQSLGLNRNASTTQLAAEIDYRLADSSRNDPSGNEELSTARAVLGNDTRRSLYDQRLADPGAPEIDIAALRELASLDVADSGGTGGAGATGGGRQFQQQAGQFARQAGGRATETGRQVQDSFKQSNLLAIAITAVVTAVVVGLAGWMLGLFGGDDHRSAKSTVNDMLDHNDADELQSWIQDNSTYQDRDDVLSTLRLSGSGSFSGMDSLFGGTNLSAGDGTVGMEQLQMSVGAWDTDEWFEELESDGYSREEIESLVAVSVVDGDEIVGSVMMLERDGDHQVVDVSIF